MEENENYDDTLIIEKFQICNYQEALGVLVEELNDLDKIASLP